MTSWIISLTNPTLFLLQCACSSLDHAAVRLVITFYQPRSGRSSVGVGQKKRKKGHVSFFIAILASVPGIFSTGPIIWVSMDLPGPQQSYLRQFGPRGQILGPRALWPQIQKFAIFSQNPTQYVSMELPGPQQSF